MLLDEPMVGLDPAAIKELKQVVLELKEAGVTILISTHMLEMVKDLWDVMFIMEKGKIIGSYSRAEAKDQDIEELFFSITGEQHFEQEQNRKPQGQKPQEQNNRPEQKPE